ncbi:MAG TPA: hypothetical protein VFX59_08095 [Polyangiales bacterium]|nr:hypothetical protein [Polyangiales bacterium]
MPPGVPPGAPRPARRLVLRAHHDHGPARIAGATLSIAPSRPLAVGALDYTRHARIDEAIAQGRRDAQLYGALLRSWLTRP